jgi:hypothetical protein
MTTEETAKLEGIRNLIDAAIECGELNATPIPLKAKDSAQCDGWTIHERPPDYIATILTDVSELVTIQYEYDPAVAYEPPAPDKQSYLQRGVVEYNNSDCINDTARTRLVCSKCQGPSDIDPTTADVTSCVLGATVMIKAGSIRGLVPTSALFYRESSAVELITLPVVADGLFSFPGEIQMGRDRFGQPAHNLTP